MDLNKIMFEIRPPTRMSENEEVCFQMGATRMFNYLKEKYELGHIPAPQPPQHTTTVCQNEIKN